jgi:hypothetical protein
MTLGASFGECKGGMFFSSLCEIAFKTTKIVMWFGCGLIAPELTSLQPIWGHLILKRGFQTRNCEILSFTNYDIVKARVFDSRQDPAWVSPAMLLSVRTSIEEQEFEGPNKTPQEYFDFNKTPQDHTRVFASKLQNLRRCSCG